MSQLATRTYADRNTPGLAELLAHVVGKRREFTLQPSSAYLVAILGKHVHKATVTAWHVRGWIEQLGPTSYAVTGEHALARRPSPAQNPRR